MTAVDFVAPTSVADAVAALGAASGEARILAGGTDLLVQMQSGRLSPQTIVDIKRIPETRQISESGGAFTIGAAVCGAEMSEHKALCDAWPGIVEATDLIGSQQIQGRATPGGNLCNASPAADSVPAFIAAGATCKIAGSNGEREVPVEDIVTGPGQTSLGANEFVVSFALPARQGKSADAYLRFIPRTEMDIAVVGAGVNLTLDDGGTCTAARVALGAVAPTQVLVPDGAAALIGSKIDESALDKLAKAASAACNPIDDKRGTVEYRTKVAGVLATRAAKIAAERANNR